MYKFQKWKINMQQVSWTKKRSARSKFNEQILKRNKFHEQNQFLEKKNQCTKFHEEWNRRAESFTNKKKYVTSFTKKISKQQVQLTVSFTRRKINLQVSQREKQHVINFASKNQHAIKFYEQKFYESKFSEQQAPLTKSISRRKTIYKFH